MRVLYACCMLWAASAAALAEPARITPTPAIVETSTADRIGSVLLDRRVWTLLAIGGVIGMIIGFLGRDPREPRIRLLNKPKKIELSILVPPGPAPRLIPSDSPHATRPRSKRAPIPRQTPVGAARPRVIDYLAAFTDASETKEGSHVDYLLVSGDNVEEGSSQ